MSKSKKKRNKKYTGQDAKSDVNMIRVRKVNAIVRSPFKQWVHEHWKFLRRVTVIVVVAAVIIFLLVQAFIAMSN
ncbi:hypothetical protein FWC31_03485 [Candidatus Saccharibacteria bacterium]|nr:hypothetical protein [Candidatus Saccharibacteria bacterium]